MIKKERLKKMEMINGDEKIKGFRGKTRKRLK